MLRDHCTDNIPLPAVDVDQLSSGVSINTKQKVFSFKQVNGERIQFFTKHSSRFRFEKRWIIVSTFCIQLDPYCLIHVALVQDSFLTLPPRVVLCKVTSTNILLFSLQSTITSTLRRCPIPPSPFTSKTIENGFKPNTTLRQDSGLKNQVNSVLNKEHISSQPVIQGFLRR